MSGSILVFIEQASGEPQKSGLVALEAARQIQAKWGNGSISTLCLGAGAKGAAEAMLQYGVAKALYSEEASFSQYRAIAYEAAFLKGMESVGATVGIAAATTTGKDFLPRCGVQLDAGQASDIIAVNDDGSLRRPMYAGDVLADVEITSEKKLVTVRTSAFAAAEPTATSGTSEELNGVAVGENAGEITSFEASGGDRPELTEADIVVSGGRALQSEENFEKYIFPLADALGAAVGASRAAVDSGYAPNDWQVGQTGKIVAPNLYVAVGISGAIQHLAGMKDSKTIVAINKDPEAPIYEVADFGLVADLYEAVPELTEKVKAAKAG
ncbi:MAG: electron transfer flavoprotein subunit alpha/FixB family protein [Bdellovibrionales bacterium]|nr:electron transfer flavoprotein subunit alpha/FixB family protein [Bdellovibrionales bacterium]